MSCLVMMGERQRIANLLKNCSRNLLLQQGRQAHSALLKMGLGFDMMICNYLIDMYGKCGEPYIAHLVFNKMLVRNVVSWTSLMCGYLHRGNARESLTLFTKMVSSGVEPNEFTYSTNFKACGLLGIPENGVQIHGLCAKSYFGSTTVVSNSIMDMYSKCGNISEATRMFKTIPVRNLVSWNAMIAGYVLQEEEERALLLFKKMQQEGEVPDEFTFTSLLKACSGLGAMPEGTQIHAFLIRRGFRFTVQTNLVGALIDLYVKCGYLCWARNLFDHNGQNNVLSWTSLIMGYAKDCNLAKAMDLFRKLMESQSQLDGLVLSTMMGIFADLALVEQGKQLHAYSIKVPSGTDISVCNSVLDMYLKCASLEEAEIYFDEMPAKNVVSWTVMITGYGKHGLGKHAISLFKEMQSNNIEPDGVTYLAILSACSHSGLVGESQEYFSSLCNNPRVKPKLEHYACVVDILGRAGRLNEARSLIHNMPLKPSIGIWQTLLSACRLHMNMEMAKEVSNILLELDGDNPIYYVTMSNLYVEAGYGKESEKIRKVMKMKGLKKQGGHSWIEVDKEVHFFYSGDDTHRLTDKIHELLKNMGKSMREEICSILKIRCELYDVDGGLMQESLRVNSEKLAKGL